MSSDSDHLDPEDRGEDTQGIVENTYLNLAWARENPIVRRGRAREGLETLRLAGESEEKVAEQARLFRTALIREIRGLYDEATLISQLGEDLENFPI